MLWIIWARDFEDMIKLFLKVFYGYVTGDENTWAFAVCGDIDN